MKFRKSAIGGSASLLPILLVAVGALCAAFVTTTASGQGAAKPSIPRPAQPIPIGSRADNEALPKNISSELDVFPRSEYDDLYAGLHGICPCFLIRIRNVTRQPQEQRVCLADLDLASIEANENGLLSRADRTCRSSTPTSVFLTRSGRELCWPKLPAGPRTVCRVSEQRIPRARSALLPKGCRPLGLISGTILGVSAVTVRG